MTEAVACPRCWQPLPIGTLSYSREFFCSSCGVRLRTVVQVADDATSPVPVAATRRPPAMKRRGLSHLIALGLIILTVLGSGVATTGYFILTAPRRLEANAADVLRLEMLLRSYDFRETETVEALDNGTFGKHRFSQVRPTWQMRPNPGSQNFPFIGTVEISYDRWATVNHSTKAKAENDTTFFHANYQKLSFYDDAADAQRAARFMTPKEKWVGTYLYDRSKGMWIKQSEEFAAVY